MARAKHFALAAQYCDAHSCLMNNGFLDIADSCVLSQFDELIVPSSDEPGDLFTDKKYDFEIGDIWVKISGGEPMQVPCFRKFDSQHRPKARPIVVGLALRSITERIPCAQLKGQFARVFAVARQLGVAGWVATKGGLPSRACGKRPLPAP